MKSISSIASQDSTVALDEYLRLKVITLGNEISDINRQMITLNKDTDYKKNFGRLIILAGLQYYCDFNKQPQDSLY